MYCQNKQNKHENKTWADNEYSFLSYRFFLCTYSLTGIIILSTACQEVKKRNIKITNQRLELRLETVEAN